MSYREKLFLLAVASVLAIFIGYGLESILDLEYIGLFIGIFSLVSLLSFIALLFFPEEVFRGWKKFAIWYTGISAVIVILDFITSQHGGLMDSDTEFTIEVLAGLFLIISAGVIIKKIIDSEES